MAGIKKLPTLRGYRTTKIAAHGAHVKGIKSPSMHMKTSVPKMKMPKKISMKVASPLKFKA